MAWVEPPQVILKILYPNFFRIAMNIFTPPTPFLSPSYRIVVQLTVLAAQLQQFGVCAAFFYFAVAAYCKSEKIRRGRRQGRHIALIRRNSRTRPRQKVLQIFHPKRDMLRAFVARLERSAGSLQRNNRLREIKISYFNMEKTRSGLVLKNPSSYPLRSTSQQRLVVLEQHFIYFKHIVLAACDEVFDNHVIIKRTTILITW
jgi:hypothetical protein